MGLVWLTPVLGSVLYMLLGVNRISRQVGAMRGHAPRDNADRAQTVRARTAQIPANILPGDAPPTLQAIARLVGTVTREPLVGGCSVEALLNGDEAYPAMIAGIDAATQSVALATYIFDRGEVGAAFVDALGRAVRRGVEVRVLIDGVGALYSRPPIVHELKHRGVPVARFLPPSLPVRHAYFNLRNHRKLLVVDGRLGFCGGMNIRDACVLARMPRGATQDIHFRVRGPIVGQLLDAFQFDWQFTTRERLDGAVWSAVSERVGSVAARGIPDGPDEDFETLVMAILGALASARESVRIVTPYFLPDPPVIAALRVAALRGVEVTIVIPEHGNLKLVEWAANAQARAGPLVGLPRPPVAPSVRPLEDVRGRRHLVLDWVGQLGSAQLAIELRVRRRVLLSGARRAVERHHRRQAGAEPPPDARRARFPSPVPSLARRRRLVGPAVSVNGGTLDVGG